MVQTCTMKPVEFEVFRYEGTFKSLNKMKDFFKDADFEFYKVKENGIVIFKRWDCGVVDCVLKIKEGDYIVKDKPNFYRGEDEDARVCLMDEETLVNWFNITPDKFKKSKKDDRPLPYMTAAAMKSGDRQDDWAEYPNEPEPDLWWY